MKNKISLYGKLIETLKDEISNMEEGDKIPSERQLCEIYTISRTTVRNAITELEYAGYVKRVQGKGTFVTNPNFERQNLSNYYSFTEKTKELGKTPKSIILEYHIHKTDSFINSVLNTKTGDLVIEFVRLRLSDNEPMLLETTYIKYEDFPEITKSLLERMPLYNIFEKKYSRKIVKVNEIFSGTILNSKQANLLQTKKNTASMKIVRYSYDKDDNIIEYTESFAPSEKFEYETIYYPE